MTDVQFSTMALLDNNAKPYERVWDTPYGEARHHWGQDFDGDRDFDSADTSALLNKISGGSVPITDTANYHVEYDLNRDGTIVDPALEFDANSNLIESDLRRLIGRAPARSIAR